MKSMIRCVLSAFLWAVGAIAYSQSNSFMIGVNGFAPEFHPMLHRTHFVQGVRATPTPDERLFFLSPTQFDLARELGANMVASVLFSDSVVTSIEPNAVHQICDSAAPGWHPNPLQVTVLDPGLGEILAGERIMLHAESGLDFTERGSHDLVAGMGFNHLPIPDANLAAPLEIAAPTYRCVRIEAGSDTIAGIVEDHKRHLSMFREWWDAGDLVEKAASGLYLLSVTAQLDGSLADPHSRTEMMYVEVLTVDPSDTSNHVVLSFPLLESQFFDTNNNLITHPIEIVLGGIEVRETNDTIVYIIPRNATNTAWNDTTLSEFVKILENNEYWNVDSIHKKLDRIDIRITSGTSLTPILLDAVCLTTPRAFSMFYPNDPIVSGGTLNSWSRTRENCHDRLAALLTDGGKAGGVLPALRFIYGPEQIPRSAMWTQSSVLEQFLDSASGGSVHLYCALGSSEDPLISAAFSQRFASGYYSYPIPAGYIRPVYPEETPGMYHYELNRPSSRGFA